MGTLGPIAGNSSGSSDMLTGAVVSSTKTTMKTMIFLGVVILAVAILNFLYSQRKIKKRNS